MTNSCRETSKPVTRLCTWQETNASAYASRRNNAHFVKVSRTLAFTRSNPDPIFRSPGLYFLWCVLYFHYISILGTQ